MLIIDDAAALEVVADPDLRAILAGYADMIDLATIYIVAGPADGRKLPLSINVAGPLPTGLVKANPGGWYEIVAATDDWGAGDVILIPDRAGTDPALLNLCRDHADVQMTTWANRPANHSLPKPMRLLAFRHGGIFYA